MFVDVDGTNARLRATVTSDNWIIKTYVRSLDLNSCECITPTISSVINQTGGLYTINFNLNSATASSTTIESSSDQITWVSSTGGTTSPRTINSGDGTSIKYFRMKTTCSNSINSEYSNMVEAAADADCTFTGADSDYTADCGQAGGSAAYQA